VSEAMLPMAIPVDHNTSV